MEKTYLPVQWQQLHLAIWHSYSMNGCLLAKLNCRKVNVLNASIFPFPFCNPSQLLRDLGNMKANERQAFCYCSQGNVLKAAVPKIPCISEATW